MMMCKMKRIKYDVMIRHNKRRREGNKNLIER